MCMRRYIAFILLQNLQILHPIIPDGTIGSNNLQIYPSECRQRADTYKGRLCGNLECCINGIQLCLTDVFFGEIPIMIKVN